jgi:hypothetical protein
MTSYFPDISQMPVRYTILQLKTEGMKMHCLVRAVTHWGAALHECGTMAD